MYSYCWRLLIVGFLPVFMLGKQAWADSAATEALYNKLCGVCHGNQGDGRGRAGGNLRPKPSNFTLKKRSVQEISDVILNGKPGTAMVGYARRLEEKQAVELARFIQQRFMPGGGSPVTAVKGEGHTLYIEHCAACHGDQGNTAVWAKNGLKPPPRDFTSAQAVAELSYERMISSVTHGRPGTAMMAFQGRLSAQQINAVVQFIRNQFLGKAQMVSMPQTQAHEQTQQFTPMINMSLGFANNVQGDWRKGRDFFQQNCYSCHGKTGKGDGPRAHFNNPKPRDFTSHESRQRFNRPALFSAISQGKRGTVMPAWRQVLTDQEIADVAEYVFQVFIIKKKKS